MLLAEKSNDSGKLPAAKRNKMMKGAIKEVAEIDLVDGINSIHVTCSQLLQEKLKLVDI